MIPVADAAWVEQRIQEIKLGAAQFTTNAFLTPAKLGAWIGSAELFGLPLSGCVFLLRKDRDFHHLYYFAASPTDLLHSLPVLDRDVPGTVVCDVVGKRADVDAVSPLLGNGGFRKLASLYRMVKIMSGPGEPDAADSGVVPAENADAQEVVHLLNTAFDPYVEQIPHPAEIAAAIGNRNILIVKRGGEVAGLLHFELAGLTATVRYWFVGPAYRGQGIASSLMRRFLAQCGKAKRVVLWVRAANDNAIARYRHFGFVSEDLADEVLIRQGSRK
jgi:ribosomal protein S18 acetylase RimI-like enzyme